MTEPIDEEQWARSLAARPERRSVTVETLVAALTEYAQIGDWLHGGISPEMAREVATVLLAKAVLPHDATEPAGPQSVFDEMDRYGRLRRAEAGTPREDERLREAQRWNDAVTQAHAEHDACVKVVGHSLDCPRAALSEPSR